MNIWRNIDEFQKYYNQKKKPDTKAYILYDSIYMTFWERLDYRKKLG